jgi:leucyl-tRNA synthetase
VIRVFVLLLSPFAPHMAEELWFRLGNSTSLAYQPFPEVNYSFKVTNIELHYICLSVEKLKG